MKLGTAVILLVLDVAGIVMVAKFMRKMPKVRIICLVLLSLTAMALVGYIGLTFIFLDALRNQPPAQ